jgi:hypothetical protein
MSYVFVVRNPLGQVEVELTSDAASTPEGGTCTGYIEGPRRARRRALAVRARERRPGGPRIGRASFPRGRLSRQAELRRRLAARALVLHRPERDEGILGRRLGRQWSGRSGPLGGRREPYRRQGHRPRRRGCRPRPRKPSCWRVRLGDRLWPTRPRVGHAYARVRAHPKRKHDRADGVDRVAARPPHARVADGEHEAHAEREKHGKGGHAAECAGAVAPCDPGDHAHDGPACVPTARSPGPGS